MTKQKIYHYRGYDLVSKSEGPKWRVSIYSTRPDLPLLSQSTGALETGMEEGLHEAKQRVDRILSVGKMPQVLASR